MSLFLPHLYGAATPKRLEVGLPVITDYVIVIKNFLNPEGHQIPSLVQNLRPLYWRGGFCLLVELQRRWVCACSLRSRLVSTDIEDFHGTDLICSNLLQHIDCAVSLIPSGSQGEGPVGGGGHHIADPNWYGRVTWHVWNGKLAMFTAKVFWGPYHPTQTYITRQIWFIPSNYLQSEVKVNFDLAPQFARLTKSLYCTSAISDDEHTTYCDTHIWVKPGRRLRGQKSVFFSRP